MEGGSAQPPWMRTPLPLIQTPPWMQTLLDVEPPLDAEPREQND